MWMLKYDDYDFSQNKKEIVKNYWTEITQRVKNFFNLLKIIFIFYLISENYF